MQMDALEAKYGPQWRAVQALYARAGRAAGRSPLRGWADEKEVRRVQALLREQLRERVGLPDRPGLDQPFSLEALVESLESLEARPLRG